MTEEYDSLKTTILSCYNRPFELYIETKYISNVSLYMVMDFAFFLNTLKKKEPYLKYTTMNVYSETIYNLLYKLFTYLSRPIAPVKILYFEDDKLKYIKTFFP